MDRIPQHLVPGLRHRHGGHLLHRGRSRKEKLDLDKVSPSSPASAAPAGWRATCQSRLLPHHPRTRHPLRHGPEARQPELKVVVYSGDGDLTGIGGNHFIHAARRNMDMVVMCVNNFTLRHDRGAGRSTTPLSAPRSSTAPYGNFEHAFSLPYLAEAAGATYVARWTTLPRPPGHQGR